MIIARRHVASLLELTDAERDALADVIRRLAVRYDNLFEVSFPYTMGLHQEPTDGQAHPEWLVTHHMRLEEAERAFRLMLDEPDSTLKVILTP